MYSLLYSTRLDRGGLSPRVVVSRGPIGLRCRPRLVEIPLERGLTPLHLFVRHTFDFNLEQYVPMFPAFTDVGGAPEGVGGVR